MRDRDALDRADETLERISEALDQILVALLEGINITITDLPGPPVQIVATVGTPTPKEQNG